MKTKFQLLDELEKLVTRLHQYQRITKGAREVSAMIYNIETELINRYNLTEDELMEIELNFI